MEQYWDKHPNAKSSLTSWIEVTAKAKWHSIQDVRNTYPHADLVTVSSGNTVVVFNIAGNNHHMIVALHYNRERVFILKIMTHAEYNKNHWKKEL